MPIPKKDPEILALESVHSALKPLDAESRRRVIASVFQLLDIQGITASMGAPATSPSKTTEPSTRPYPPRPSRPVSLNELINEKKPGTSAQFIALFAYYRERSEGLSRFSRNDLEVYFSRAKQIPPKNFDRDFVESVKKGWLHEDGNDSYLTSKGIEAVESGFEGERKLLSPTKHARRKQKKSK